MTILGVAGTYPSSSNKLAGSTANADLDVASFNAKIKAPGTFQWFDASGNIYTATGSSNITAGNIANGVTIFGTTGTLANSNCSADNQVGCITTSTYKSADTTTFGAWDLRYGKTVAGVAGQIAFYRNLANTTLFDRTSGTGGASGLDIYDTIDDYNNFGSFPSQNPWSPTVPVPGSNWTAGTGGRTDQITGLTWAVDTAATPTWEEAITQCATATTGGLSAGSWRLPTLKELEQAYIDGIWGLQASLSLGFNYYWSSLTVYNTTTYASLVVLYTGGSANSSMINPNRVICVR